VSVPEARSGPGRLELTVTSLPGLVGIGLGLIYAIGAIQILGQASAAGLTAYVVLPVYPLDAVIARGVSFGMSLLAILLAVLVVALLVPPFRAWVSRSKVGARHFGFLLHGTSERVVLLASFIAVAIFGVFAPVIALVMGFCVLAVWFAYWKLRELGWGMFGRVVVAATVGLLTLTVFGSFLAARAYPEVVATLRSGQLFEGRLLVQTDGALYVERGGLIRSVPARSIREVAIYPPAPNNPRSLFELIFD
jgi:hypothetical protein